MATPGGERILVALDTTDAEAAAALAVQLVGVVGGVKLGKEFFTANGPQGVRQVTQSGMPLFLDLKFHDIPNTVAGAIRASVGLGPAIVNLHASGGSTMMKAAAQAATEAAQAQGVARPMVIGVTVLTSMAAEDMVEIGVNDRPNEQVVRLARLAKANGLDGVVCSAREIVAIRGACGADFKLIVPGIRPSWASPDDQKRIMTPSDAIALGADYLVIGRPITKADDPVEAAKRIAAEIAAG